MSRASVRYLRSRTQRVEQSKFTRPHYMYSKPKVSVLPGIRKRGWGSATHFVEVRAEGVGEGVNFVEIELLAIFIAGEGDAGPCSIDMDP